MGTEDTSDRANAEDRLGREEKQSVQGYIAIKGTRNGLLLTLEPETPFSELLNALADRLAEAPAFFRGASLSVDTSRRMLRISERVQLEDLLAHYQMSVMPLELTTHTRQLAQRDTKTVVLQPLETPGETPAAPPSLELTQGVRNPRESADTLFLRRTVRS